MSPPATWHTLAVQCQGNQISISGSTDQPVMPPLQDNTFAAGKIGFWTKSDAVSYFGDPVTIDYTPLHSGGAGAGEQHPGKTGAHFGPADLHAFDDKGQPHIIASKDEKEIGQPGTDAEKDAIANGKVYYGKSDGVDAIVAAVPRPQRRPDGRRARAFEIIFRRVPGKCPHPRDDVDQDHAGTDYHERGPVEMSRMLTAWRARSFHSVP
jgi:hypothetical protein